MFFLVLKLDLPKSRQSVAVVQSHLEFGTIMLYEATEMNMILSSGYRNIKDGLGTYSLICSASTSNDLLAETCVTAMHCCTKWLQVNENGIGQYSLSRTYITNDNIYKRSNDVEVLSAKFVRS
jgi:hypothetical protein